MQYHGVGFADCRELIGGFLSVVGGDGDGDGGYCKGREWEGYGGEGMGLGLELEVEVEVELASRLDFPCDKKGHLGRPIPAIWIHRQRYVCISTPARPH